jgi:D-3-phosphoglycerate dehydrogenase
MSLTPHIGANTQEAMENVASMVVTDVINALRGREVKSPVNFPLQESSATPFVKAYKKLAERMGKLFPALFGLKTPVIEIELLGSAKNLGDIVKAYFLKGLLTQITDAHVNEINAPYLAKEKGIELIIKTGNGLHNFKNIIFVKGYDSGKNKIAGSVFDEKYYRILNIKDFWFEIEPRGELLFFETIDAPGIIGEIGYKIASRGYNISDLRYFTRRKFGLGILKLNKKPERELLDELKNLEYITNVAYVSL